MAIRAHRQPKKEAASMFLKNVRQPQNLLAILLGAAIIIILAVETIINLTPVIDRDGLIHHLAIPKLWLKNGGFYETRWAIFSYYPMNLDLLYLIPLYLKKDFLAKFIHMGFGLGTGLLIYIYLKNKLSRAAGFLGALVFLSTPMIIRLSTQAYVDLGLVFFTTASLLALVRYRDGGYLKWKWLILASVAMGLALGTKYNALVAWFFLSLALVFVISRDTQMQGKAIGCGLIFFLISFLLFSPWLVKNLFLTGNPLYPLMQGFFNSDQSLAREGTFSIVSGNKYMGIFQIREAMYGEGFWETLLIPVRYFFQGQDDNARYFDGILSPALIITVPFAFMNRKLRAEMILLASFSLFILLMASFLDQTRIRYILSAVPPLAILSVVGLANIWNFFGSRADKVKYGATIGLILIFVLLLGRNFSYLADYYQKISPMNYICAKETRDEFISRYVGSYPAMQFVNKHTPENSHVRLIFLAGRGYYLDRTYEDSPDMGMSFIRGLAKAATGETSFQKYLHSSGYTHLLVRTDLFHSFVHDNYPETKTLLIERIAETMDVLYRQNGYAVYQIHKNI